VLDLYDDFQIIFEHLFNRRDNQTFCCFPQFAWYLCRV